jgi:hypothetical protein
MSAVCCRKLKKEKEKNIELGNKESIAMIIITPQRLTECSDATATFSRVRSHGNGANKRPHFT